MRNAIKAGLFLIGLLLMPQAKAAEMTFSVTRGYANTPLSIVETGNRQGPAILFIHGYSQSYLSWSKQLNDPELLKQFHLIAFDLRGHGSSGNPADPESFMPRAWADDLAAVIKATGHRKPVIVGWSMGEAVTLNYMMFKGQQDIAALNAIAGSATLTQTRVAAIEGQDTATATRLAMYKDMQSNDILVNLAATRAFVGIMTAKPLPPAETETMVIYNMLTPAHVRLAMFLGPRADHTPLKGKIVIPVLISHGDKDVVVPYQNSLDLKHNIPAATLSTYNDVGHSPFMEDPVRFNRELTEFVLRANKAK